MFAETIAKKEGKIVELERDKNLLVDLVLDTTLTPAAKNLVAIAIRDGGMPPTDETRVWYKIRVG